MTPRSPDDIMAQVERGAAMQACLDSPAFKEAVDHLTNYHVAAMVACRPGYTADADALAHHHLMQHALTEIVATMQQWASVGAQAQLAHDWTLEHGDDN
jgi:uridylate kinase